eukprot:8016641-Prorocentrum_lima.AAC.1
MNALHDGPDQRTAGVFDALTPSRTREWLEGGTANVNVSAKALGHVVEDLQGPEDVRDQAPLQA